MDSNLNRKIALPLLAALTVFVISRILYDRAGIIFQDTYLGYWQFIDPQLLQQDLLRNVYFLHSQPPLMNLITGLTLKIFPSNPVQVFHGLYFLSGLILTSAIFGLGLQLRLSPWLSAALSAWFIVSPATVLYEHWMTYAYPVAVVLSLAGVFLYQFVISEKSVWGHICFSLLALVALTWSLFHLAWLIAIALAVGILLPDRRKTFFVCFFPILITTCWYAKNLFNVGEFSASSWAGMNLSRITTFRVSGKERKEMVAMGNLSKFAMLPPFRDPQDYLELLPNTPLTGIPVLDELETSQGRPNYHHLVFVEASNYYLKDALFIIRARPQIYLQSIGQAFYIYFHSPSDFEYLSYRNREKIETLDRWWNRVFYGQWTKDGTSEDRLRTLSIQRVGWWTVFEFAIVVIGSGVYFWKKRAALREPVNFLALFIIFNILYLTIVGNFMDIGENNRFRFTIDPFIDVLFVFFLAPARLKFQSLD